MVYHAPMCELPRSSAHRKAGQQSFGCDQQRVECRETAEPMAARIGAQLLVPPRRGRIKSAPEFLPARRFPSLSVLATAATNYYRMISIVCHHVGRMKIFADPMQGPSGIGEREHNHNLFGTRRIGETDLHGIKMAKPPYVILVMNWAINLRTGSTEFGG